MKWKIPLHPKDPHLEAINVIEMQENVKPAHGYFADYIRRLANKYDWTEVTGSFRIIRHGKTGIVIELNDLKES